MTLSCWQSWERTASYLTITVLQSSAGEHTPELAEIITAEQGKTIAYAKGDIFRGLEVVEFACGVAPMMMGETIENVSAGMDTYS